MDDLPFTMTDEVREFLLDAVTHPPAPTSKRPWFGLRNSLTSTRITRTIFLSAPAFVFGFIP